MPQAETITRIRSLAIRDVRGFGGQHTVNLDADIVLLSGSNGFGKTSLIDCLNLLLNGRDPRITGDLRFRDSQHGEIQVRALCLESHVETTRSLAIDHGRIQVSMGQELSEVLCSLASVFYQHDIGTYLEGESGAASPLYQFLCPDSQEHRLACDFLAKARKELENSKARRMAPGVESQDIIHAERRKVAAELKQAWQQTTFLPHIYKEELQLSETPSDRRSWEKPLRRLAESVLQKEIQEDTGALACLEDLQQHFADPKFTRGLPRDQVAVEGRLAPSALLLQSTWEIFGPDELFSVLDPEEPMERGTSTVLALDSRSEEKVELFLRDLQLELDEAEGEIERLQAYSRHFTSASSSDLEEVMETLVRCGESWADFPGPSPLKTPQSLLERLSRWLRESSKALTQGDHPLFEAFRSWRAGLSAATADLQEHTNCLRRNLRAQEMALTISRTMRAIEPRRAAGSLVQEVQGLGEIQVAQLRSRLESALSSLEVPGVLVDLDRVSSLLQSWIEVEKAQLKRDAAMVSSSSAQASGAILDQALRAIHEELSSRGILTAALEVPPGHVKSLEDSINQLLSRFRCVDGMLPIHLEGKAREGWRQVAGTGIGHRSLSTGQQALVAVAITLSLNLLFEHLLPHRVILLDDVTASLDMGQLTRAAILFRQFAYGSGLEPEESRRQLILSSHHEDLTNRLLDFLMPPPGRSLKVVQFQGWSPERGPALQVFRVDGEKRLDKGTEAFRSSLSRAFEESLGYLF